MSYQHPNFEEPADDGYNWRKCSSLLVKGSKFFRSYQYCKNPECPAKKIVMRYVDGQITKIIYIEQHNHEPLRNTTRGNKDSMAKLNGTSMSYEDMPEASDPEEVGNGEIGVREKDENEAYPKIRTADATEPTFAIRTTSEVDVLDDGYRWSTYTQSIIKGYLYPRKYYKCKTEGCGVRKHVQRLATDPKDVVTTYRGRHNHDLPTAISSSHAAQRTADSHGTVTETSEVGLLDDGYRWRQYATYVVKGNLYPRRYYKCTTQGCGVTKQVERVATDPKDVVTTYRGRHNHDLPAAISSNHSSAAAQLRPEVRYDSFANLNHQQKQTEKS